MTDATRNRAAAAPGGWRPAVGAPWSDQTGAGVRIASSACSRSATRRCGPARCSRRFRRPRSRVSASRVLIGSCSQATDAEARSQPSVIDFAAATAVLRATIFDPRPEQGELLAAAA